MTETIRGNSILPAHREAITLETADGLSLVGELALPQDSAPVATMVCLHPLPTHGGMMDSHLFRKAAYRLPALAGIAVLRFNTRGTSSIQGTSEGIFNNAEEEKYDVAAAIEYAEFADLPNIWLVGWSFGTDLALMHGLDPAVAGLILLSPPLRYSGPEHLVAWAESRKPVTALVPELDDY
ncbi:MAG: alpha/beta hydrolase, partial [Aeromicrobium sp.]